MKLPETMKDEISKLYFVMPPGKPNRATSTLATVNDICIFSFMRNSNDPSMENILLQLLEEDGLEVFVEGSIEYES